jgi:hypothetical protein
LPSGKWVIRVAAVALVTFLAAKWAGKTFGIAPLVGL